MPYVFTNDRLTILYLDTVKKELFPIPNALEEAYLTLSEKQRVPQALELYASRIEDPEAKEEMARFVQAVLSNTFTATRYKVEGNPHAEALAACKGKEASDSVWDLWQKLPARISGTAPAAAAGAGAGSLVESSAGAADERKPIDIRRWMVEKLVTDKHAGALLPDIRKFLETGERFRSDNTIDRICYALVGCKTLDKQVEALRGLQKALIKEEKLESTQWKKDVDDLLIGLEKEEDADFTAVITDAWEDLFLCGTEVLGSCQRIDGSPHLNKCLLGYCMDGKVQMIALKDPKSGKIISRALLKLFVKKTGHKIEPALFLERIYPIPLPREQLAAINEMAKRCARELGVSLYSLNPDLTFEKGFEPIESLACPSPWEYEGGGIGITDGKYTVFAKRTVM